jgi:hypothetical protein
LPCDWAYGSGVGCMVTIRSLARSRSAAALLVEEEARLRRRVKADVALVPVRVGEGTVVDSRRGEPVTVLLRSGHMLKVGRDFDEQTFAHVVALLERV